MALVGLGWAVVGSAYAWTQRQYYVGVEAGEVAIFRGLPTTVAGFDLGTAIESTGLQLEGLSDFDAGKVSEGVTQSSREAAQKYVQNLVERQINAGETPAADVTPTPLPKPSVTQTPAPSPAPESPSAKPDATSETP